MFYLSQLSLIYQLRQPTCILVSNIFNPWFYACHRSQLRGNSQSGSTFVVIDAAEDRILGFEIVAKKDACWRLHYDGAAQAATDVPSSVGVLVKQRRRWLNGSFFATLYAIGNWGRMMRGNRHGIFQRLLFALLYFWNLLNIFLAW